MMKVYLDLGLKTDATDGVMTVAAATFKPIAYKRFVRPWNRMLTGWNADAFHSTDFYPGGGQFKRNTIERKERFDRDARIIPGLISQHVTRLSAIGFRPDEFVRMASPEFMAAYGRSLHSMNADAFLLITRFTKHRDEWIDLACVNIHDGRPYRLARAQTPAFDRAVPRTFRAVLHQYLLHREAKSLAPDGNACEFDTRGLLGRAHVVAGALIPIGKEADRRWEYGEDVSLLDHGVAKYASTLAAAEADTRAEIQRAGMRTLMRAGCNQHTLKKILAGKPVRRATMETVMRELAWLAPTT